MRIDNTFHTEVVQYFEELEIQTSEIIEIQNGKTALKLDSENLVIVCSTFYSGEITNKDVINNPFIHLWQDQWQYHQEKVKSMLAAQVGHTCRIFARNTVARQIDGNISKTFLNKNHIMASPSSFTKLGLFRRTELLAVMTFSKPRPMTRKGDDYKSVEIIRFCNRLHETVIGGMSKLINHYLKSFQPDDFMTSCDLDWADGASLSKLGFVPTEITPPLKFVVNNSGKRQIITSSNENAMVINQGNQRFLLHPEKLTLS